MRAATGVAVFAVFASSVALGQEHVPHTGFFLHGDSGLGFLTGSASNSRSLGGVTIGGALDIGGTVVRGWELSGTVEGQTAPGLSLSTSFAQENGVSGSIWMLGVRGTHYFGASNLFASMAAGIGQIGLSDSRDSVSLNIGPFGEVTFGKEWLVGEHWGLGVAVRVALMSNQDVGDSDAWTLILGGAVFSITLN